MSHSNIKNIDIQFATQVSEIVNMWVSDDETRAKNWSLDQISQHLNKKEAIGFFYEQNLAAFVLFQKLEPHLIDIEYLSTHKDHAKNGYMKKLIEHLIKSLAPSGEIWLEVHKENLRASKLYESLGFFEQGLRKNYYGPGKDAQLMKYVL